MNYTMTKEELAEGFSKGRTLVQEEWHIRHYPEEHQAIEELIAEGKAEVFADWRWRDNFQCEVRLIRGARGCKT